MRMRTLAFTLMFGGAAALMITGCSGKPENSPVIRKKLAELDKATETIERLQSDVAIISEQVRRLTEENSELRAFLPDVDGEAAVSKLTTIDRRLNQLESLAGDGVLTNLTRTNGASESAPASTGGSSEQPRPAQQRQQQQNLEDAPLAGDRPVVAQQQQTTQPRPARDAASSFREMTQAPAQQQPQQQAQQPRQTQQAPAPAQRAARGTYHTIEANETIDQIAQKHGVSKEALLQANRIPAGARLARGQRLFIPAN